MLINTTQQLFALGHFNSNNVGEEMWKKYIKYNWDTEEEIVLQTNLVAIWASQQQRFLTCVGFHKGKNCAHSIFVLYALLSRCFLSIISGHIA